ncbi:hypothetical protein [Sphingomonas bacterium]|uniref:hypothetical protein n=1 Tax=Sphingomonas bacterium TaxID=1895847 RepID=UPI0015755999|nr:hypothetical protein [Sphingomonas bacterium]
MFIKDLRLLLDETSASIQTLNRICREQQGDWRQEVVRMRRRVSDEMSRISVLVASCNEPSPSLIAFRNALSKLRSAVAHLQASWPAVSLDPDNLSYRDSVKHVRIELEALAAALVLCEQDGSGR